MSDNVLRVLGLVWLWVVCASGSTWAQAQRYSFERALMGTSFRIVLYTSNDSLAQTAASAAFERIKTLNTLLSDYLDGSEINRLSASSGTGQWVSVSPDLFAILVVSKSISKKTFGHFDCTVGPYVQLWRRALRRHYFPDEATLRSLGRRVGYRHVRISDRNQAIKLRRKGMRLDLGGIGKGYAADEALKALRTFGIGAALVDAGGDLTIGEAPPGQSGWKIAIPSYSETDTTETSLSLAQVGIATSGATYRYLEHEGKRYSHIVSPKTGVGLLHHVRTTVIAPTGTLADALATAVSVAGVADTKRFVKRMQGVTVCLAEEHNGRITYWQAVR